MKFSDGYWHLRDGISPIYPDHVHDAEVDGSVLRIAAAGRAIRNRGDTVNAPLVTVECRSPMPDVIGIRILHHSGTRQHGPHFETSVDPLHSAAVEIH